MRDRSALGLFIVLATLVQKLPFAHRAYGLAPVPWTDVARGLVWVPAHTLGAGLPGLAWRVRPEGPAA